MTRWQAVLRTARILCLVLFGLIVAHAVLRRFVAPAEFPAVETSFRVTRAAQPGVALSLKQELALALSAPGDRSAPKDSASPARFTRLLLGVLWLPCPPWLARRFELAGSDLGGSITFHFLPGPKYVLMKTVDLLN